MKMFVAVFAICIAVASAQSQFYSVGFNAYRSASVSVSPNSIIVFDAVETNVFRDDSGVLGTPYNPDNGYFTCPVTGMYYFHYTIKSDSLALFSGEIRLVGIDGVSTEARFSAVQTQQGLDTVSSACVLQCRANQDVRVYSTSTGQILEEEGKKLTNFGGMLVHAIFS